MRIGYVQTDPVFGDKRASFDRVDALCAGVRADLLVLPELFATGYTFESAEEAAGLAERADGETADYIRGLADRVGGAVVAGFAETDGRRVYNSALLADSRGVIGCYRKVHLFNREKLWFSPGGAVEPSGGCRSGTPPALRSFPVFRVGEVSVGLMICFDWIFPEAARTLAVGGADIIAHPANLVLPYCQGAMRTRCLENRLFAITANRVGTEERGGDSFTFTGASQVTSPLGEVLASAPPEGTRVDVVEIDPVVARDKRLNPYNDLLGDRRPECYGGGPGSG